MGRRRAQSAFQRFEPFVAAGAAVCYTVFTVPAELRSRFYTKKGQSKLRQGAAAILKRIGMAFGCGYMHPCGEDPDVYHPHPNFLWVRNDLQGYLSPEDLNRVKAAWSQFLEYDVQKVDVHHSYVRSLGQLWHRCKYVARTFPGWSGIVPAPAWYGQYPRLPKRAPGHLCSKCGEPVEFIGFIDKRYIEEWEIWGKRAGEDPPWDRDECLDKGCFHVHS